jgi:ABC-type lipoprotein release transport system permease subunit
MSENIVIAIISALGIALAVIGSIVGVQLTNNFNQKQQRMMDMRKVKIDCYHKFIESLEKNTITRIVPIVRKPLTLIWNLLQRLIDCHYMPPKKWFN